MFFSVTLLVKKVWEALGLKLGDELLDRHPCWDGEDLGLLLLGLGGHLSPLAVGAEQVEVIVGGVIPPKDYAALQAAGVAGVFGPGTSIPKAAREVLQVLRKRAA